MLGVNQYFTIGHCTHDSLFQQEKSKLGVIQLFPGGLAILLVSVSKFTSSCQGTKTHEACLQFLTSVSNFQKGNMDLSHSEDIMNQRTYSSIFQNSNQNKDLMLQLFINFESLVLNKILGISCPAFICSFAGRCLGLGIGNI